MGRKRVVRRRARNVRIKKTMHRRMYKKARKMKMVKHLGNVIPNNIMTKFRVTGSWAPTSYAGGGCTSFYANNPYDPVVGASTSACSGFAKLMSLYKYGICYACKASAKFMPINVNSLGYIMFTDSEVSLAAAQPSLDFLTEIPKNTVSKHHAIYSYNETPMFLKLFRTIKGIELKKELEPYDYRFEASSGPRKSIGVQIGYIPADSSNSTAYTWVMWIKITYYCRLYDRMDNFAV